MTAITDGKIKKAVAGEDEPDKDKAERNESWLVVALPPHYSLFFIFLLNGLIFFLLCVVNIFREMLKMYKKL